MRSSFTLPSLTSETLCLLHKCTLKKDLTEGRALHATLIHHGLDSIPFWADHLIRLFTSCQSLVESNRVFSRVSQPSIYTWNAIISAHAKLGHPEHVFSLYETMTMNSIMEKMKRECGVMDKMKNINRECCTGPDRVTLLSLLKCCGLNASRRRYVHHHVVLHGLESDVVLASALVDINAKCGSLRDALKLFKGLHPKDVVSWAVLMTGYIQHEFHLMALNLFEDMKIEGVKPDRVIYLCIVKACGHTQILELGRLIHAEIIKDGLEEDLTIVNTLIDMYAKCGSLGEAFKMLHKFSKRDAVSWSALLSGYVQHGYDAVVFESFCKMKEEGIKPSKVTYLCVLKGCINLLAIVQGWYIHDQIIQDGFQSDLEIGNSLVDLYAKCGMPDEGNRVFIWLPKKDIVSWGALVAGYAQVGKFNIVLHFLNDMDKKGFKPNDVIFTSIFAACSRAGSTQEAQKYFHVMVEQFSIKPNIQHYSCLIDLFGRSGLLKEAEQFFEIMPLPPDGIPWKSLLTSCKTHGSINLGQMCFDRGVELDPEDATNYELLSGLYADANVHKLKLA